MDLKSFSAEELRQKLDQKIDASTLEQLKGISEMWKARLLATQLHVVVNTSFLENEIDGEALLMLIQDLEEFSLVVPKAVSRLKLKQLVKEFLSLQTSMR